MYQHGDHEHHLFHDHGHGSDGCRSSWGCDGELVSECCYDLRIANRLGDLYLHGDDDGGLYGWDEHGHGHDYSNAEQHDCIKFGRWDQRPDAMYQHGDHEHHIWNYDSHGSDGYRSSWGCDGELVSECGDDLRIANCLGDLYLHGDDDGGLYGWDEYGHGHDYSNAEQHSGSAIEHTDPLY
jgi:hypothetical protein